MVGGADWLLPPWAGGLADEAGLPPLPVPDGPLAELELAELLPYFVLEVYGLLLVAPLPLGLLLVTLGVEWLPEVPGLAEAGPGAEPVPLLGT